MRRSAFAVLAALLTAAGCGSSTAGACDAVTNGLNGLNAKAQPCGFQIPSLGYTSQQCQQGVNASGCTDADRSKITDFGNCLSALPTCSPGNEQAWTTQLQTCADKLSSVSPACGGP